MNRSSENKVLSYRLTGQNYLTEVLAFPAKVHSKWCENGEGKSVGDSVYKVSWGKSSVEGLSKGDIPYQPDLNTDQIQKHWFATN